MSVIYTAHVEIEGGRSGRIRSDDGKLEARMSFPQAMGGTGDGTNPEQLLAAGYAACFASSMAHVAKQQGTSLPPVHISAEVDVLHDGSRFDLAVRLHVHAAATDRSVVEAVVESTRTVCPYSRMVHDAGLQHEIRVVE